MEKVKRVPIKIVRVPIKVDYMTRIQLKREELLNNTKDDDILEISSHYDMLARKQLKIAGYNSLYMHKKDPKTHRNWKYFEYIYYLCRYQEWDAKLYIEAQFERFKKTSISIPYPPNLVSDNAIRFFTNYLSTIRQTYKKDINQRKKEIGKQTFSIKEEVIEAILKSIQILSSYLDSNINYTDKKQYKAIKIFQTWEQFSPYYLWSIPWFHNVLDTLKGTKVSEYKNTFNMIRNSSTLQTIIQDTVEDLEPKYSIPQNLNL